MKHTGVEELIASRADLRGAPNAQAARDDAAEGGCGVIGMASSVRVAGRHMLRALAQMRNRGNGKGGGIAAAGLAPEEFGVTREVLERDYLLVVAYLDPAVRAEVEREYVAPLFVVDHARIAPALDRQTSGVAAIPGLDVQPPHVVQYFVQLKPGVAEVFRAQHGLQALDGDRLADEVVYQNSYRLNRAYYASTGVQRAFVLSHGKNLLVLKMVGYGDDVVRWYRLEDVHAHVWIGHHRYPTKGRVWHPGGAHPFMGMNEALVHNGDFANYASIAEYLQQRNIHQLFLTDTEVSVQVFDLLHRVYGYPLEYVIEALAPTTERDFALLPEAKQRVYRMLQQVHVHGSPDGPWFFLIAQSAYAEDAVRLIGITDTSMLRPQVFALQQGEATIGFAASEKQGIDAALESLAEEDTRFWPRADRYWNARGGSHTDGGAFLFTVRPGDATLECTDKFGRRIALDGAPRPRAQAPGAPRVIVPLDGASPAPGVPAARLIERAIANLGEWGYAGVESFVEAVVRSAEADGERARAIEVLTQLVDRRYPTGGLRRRSLLARYDAGLAAVFAAVGRAPGADYAYAAAAGARPEAPARAGQALVVDARGFAPEGPDSLALALVRLYRGGFRRFVIAHARGHRFIANGLGPASHGARFDVYGSPGDYLASGVDGAEVVVHGGAQDQLAQIMKDGRLVIYGDVGQTFLYAAKGGQAYVLGNAAGRPLINAVGKPRVVINGTCLDYLAESFMAGDPLSGGGFVVLNGVAFDDDGNLADLDTPYPGGNLFSLASGGALYLRDPEGKLSEDQLNGGEFATLDGRDWALIRPYLEENERLFGVPVARLLSAGGRTLPPERVYRKIRPRVTGVLQAEEAWVRKHA
jgi:glutamate synthase domain-containing protein 1/glutamate synthase domain-containing protein 3